MRVLIACGEGSLSQSLDLVLLSEGFTIESADCGHDAMDFAHTYPFEAFLIVGDLDDMTGLALLRSIRAAKITSPAILLSGEIAVTERLKAFAAGADDVLLMPFHKDELIARLNAVVRRSMGHSSPKIAVGPVEIDINGKVVRVEGKKLRLTGKEYQVLEALALAKGRTLTKEALYNAVYGGNSDVELKIIDVFICKARRKLKEAGEYAWLIGTEWGRGYRFLNDGEIAELLGLEAAA